VSYKRVCGRVRPVTQGYRVSQETKKEPVSGTHQLEKSEVRTGEDDLTTYGSK